MSTHRRGPARSEQARVAILEATARQFANHGYEQLTMEGIAAEAKVGKQTIYRWWPSKGALVTDCLVEGMLLPDDLNPPNTGNLRADLSAWLTEIIAIFERPGGEELLRSLIAAAAENASVGEHLYESLGTDSSITIRLKSAIVAGQLPASAPLQEIGEALVGVIILRALARIPTDSSAAERAVSAVLGTA